MGTIFRRVKDKNVSPQPQQQNNPKWLHHRQSPIRHVVQRFYVHRRQRGCDHNNQPSQRNPVGRTPPRRHTTKHITRRFNDVFPYWMLIQPPKSFAQHTLDVFWYIIRLKQPSGSQATTQRSIAITPIYAVTQEFITSQIVAL